MIFNILKQMQEKDKKLKGMKSPPSPPKKALAIMKKDELIKKPGK